MDTILGIVLLVVGTMVFVMVNKMFNIMYFGAKAIFGTWMACVIGTGIVGTIFSAFIITYYQWVIGGLVFIAFLVYKGKNSEKSKQVNEPNNTGSVGTKKSVDEITTAVIETAAATVPVVETTTIDEKSEYDVILASVGTSKMSVIAVVREVTGLGLVEAKALVDGAPKTIKEKVGKANAYAIKAKLEEAGASVELK